MLAKMSFLAMVTCALLPFLTFAEGTGRYVEGHPVLKSFRLNAFDAASDGCATEAPPCEESCKAAESPKFYAPPPCVYCAQCNYKHWCPYCGYCPLYSDEERFDEFDFGDSWPGKRGDNWMWSLEHR